MKSLSLLLVILLAMTGCVPIPGAQQSPTATQPPPVSATPAAPTNTASPAPTTTGSVEEIKALLPDRAGFRWQYFGFAEYAMTMELKSIDQANGVLSWRCEGAVADMSGGEAKGDFAVKITYKALPGVLMQGLTGEKALDSVYPELELIRAPLQQGTKWVQSVKSAKGEQASLSCSIDGVKQQNGRAVYSVTYQKQGSAYYEKREITAGIGVTAFDKLYEFESTSDLIGYRLYTPETQAQTAGWLNWLPQLKHEYLYFGLAEYGHKGALTKVSENGVESVYEFRGVYNDGSGRDDRFVVRYYADAARGTVTEQVVSNSRAGKGKEVNSKLHNLVILKFPLAQGSHWSHEAKLNGKSVTVQASVIQYDEAKGLAKVRYTAKGAAGYYDDTYIEERTFEKGWGMTGFGNLLPGGIGISASEAKDPAKLQDAITQHMFGYSMNKQS